MDEATKAVIGGWIRHIIGLAAGAMGMEWLQDPTVMTAAVTVVLAAVAFGWSSLKNYWSAPQ